MDAQAETCLCAVKPGLLLQQTEAPHFSSLRNVSQAGSRTVRRHSPQRIPFNSLHCVELRNPSSLGRK